MVIVKKTLYRGSSGYLSPVVPRAPRSLRKWNSHQKSLEGGQLCAFDLLATVAGKLLEENECSSASSSAAVGFNQHGIGKDGIKKEPQDVDKPVGGEHDNQGSSEGGVYFSGIKKGIIVKEKLEDVNGEYVSHVGSSMCFEKVNPESTLANLNNNDDFVKLTSKIILDFPFDGESNDTNLEIGLNRKVNINGSTFVDYSRADGAPVKTNSEHFTELPIRRDSVPTDSFPKRGNGVKIGCKDDDDENISRCSKPNNGSKIIRSPSGTGNQRYSKLLTSKYWKTGPKLKDCEVTNSGGAAKHTYHNKRPCYEIDRSQRDTPFKKWKLFDRSSVVTYDGGISCESVSNSPEKSRNDYNNALAGKRHEGNGKLRSPFSRQNSCNSRNSQVRLSINSFKVPELFVEVSETTTVGSLKRTVLEAVQSILGGGLHVGVLLHGKKIQDDTRTLLQTGISEDDDIDTVGFILEPNNPTQPSSPISPKEPPAPLLRDSPQFVNRPEGKPKEGLFLLGSLDKPYVTDSNIPVGTSRDLIPSARGELADKNISDSKALVSVPKALAVLPANHKSKRSEIGHRRTRRPFSVSEVEALVHAVEKIGTGRWRDVKLCSFENAKHRTYVDLKDKWKTLVHTARISPQQRRGEPVPQELLDRVLVAQSYWSEHQAKQHGTIQHSIIPKLTNSVA